MVKKTEQSGTLVSARVYWSKFRKEFISSHHGTVIIFMIIDTKNQHEYVTWTTYTTTIGGVTLRNDQYSIIYL